MSDLTVVAPSPELAQARARWDNPLAGDDRGLIHSAMIPLILAAPLRTQIGGTWSPAVIVVSHGWDKADGDRADAAGEPGSEAWIAALGTPRRVVLTSDGRGAVPGRWCTGGDEHGGDQPVFYERWTNAGRVAHGWLCPVCRCLVQSG